MKTLIVNAALACMLFAPYSAAQGRGGFGGGARGGGAPGFRPSAPYGHMGAGRPLVTGFRREHGGYAQPAYSPWDFFNPFDDYGQSAGAGDGVQSPQVIVVAPQAPPPPPPPPPEPPRPVTREYNWPAPVHDVGNVFSLVSKDGTVRYAIAVWVQDGMLNYIAQDRTAGRTRLDAIDREATLRLNVEKKLSLELPPG